VVAQHIKAELLVQIDKIRRESCTVFVLAAIDIPWRLDAATLSCFERRVYTALPDLYARMKIFSWTHKLRFDARELQGTRRTLRRIHKE
jgi:SpoVK/Ycf46/Vps4 family AAA+-type ATPase